MIVVGNSLLCYDAVLCRLEKVITLPERFSYMLRLQNASLLLFGQRVAFRFDASTNTLDNIGAIPGPVRCAVQAPNGTIYLAIGSHLYQLT